MCKFEYVNNSFALRRKDKSPCRLGEYIGILDEPDLALPIDEEGNCIFHSRLEDWKLSNSFEKWLNKLFEVILKVGKKEIDWVDENGFKRFDFRGIYFVSNTIDEDGQTTLSLIDESSEEFSFSEDLYISFEGATVACELILNRVFCERLDIDFNYATFNYDLLLHNFSCKGLNMSDSSFKGRIMINQVKFNGYFECCNSKSSMEFYIMNSHFMESAFFCETRFEKSGLSIDNTAFWDSVDFGESKVFGEISIENSSFESELKFSDTDIAAPATFASNHYNGTVYFNSTNSAKKLFKNIVYFRFSSEKEIGGKIVFENANLANIVDQDRQTLIALSRENKVEIGRGCIKYRVQTQPITIKANGFNHGIFEEIALSFSNYFTSYEGMNLGVEFTDKSVHSLTLFYFTDDDITVEDFEKSIQKREPDYWHNQPVFETNAKPNDAYLATSEIDSFVSKLSALTKIKYRQQLGLWSESDSYYLSQVIGRRQ